MIGKKNPQIHLYAYRILFQYKFTSRNTHKNINNTIYQNILLQKTQTSGKKGTNRTIISSDERNKVEST